MKMLSRLCSVLFGVVAVLAITGTPSPATVHARQATGAKTSERPMLSALATADEPTRLRANEAYGKLPLSFEANQGQTDTQVKFLSRGAGYNLFLTSTEAVLSLEQSRGTGGARESGDRRSVSVPNDVLRMKMLGANPTPRIEGSDQLPGKSNYFIGNNPKNWRVNVSTFARVHYREIYPGVDVVYYGNQRKLETDFIVAPGTNPDVIALAFDGANKISVDKEGSLVLGLASGASGDVRLQKPGIYQLIDGVRREVAGNYVMRNRRDVGFEVAAYDLTKPLVIDPVLVYSTYLGGDGTEGGNAIAVDASGNAYVTGDTSSTNFPGATPPLHGLRDAFVTKFNAAGSALVYSTYLGGNNVDYGFDIAIDGAGNAYVTGKTSSTDFPVMNAFDSTYSGGTDEDAFVTRLNAAGSALVYSTYLSGQYGARGWGIATDGAGNAYVTGTTSINFPVTANAFESTNYNSGFIAALDTNASGAASLLYSSFLAHTGFAEGRAIAADATGNVYVTGNLNSTTTDFATPGAFQTTFGGGSQDAFVEKFNTNLSGAFSRVYATYLGGSGKDIGGADGAGNSGKAIAIDESGNAYVTGATASTNFPVFPAGSAYQGVNGGQNDAFLTKLNANGSSLIYSTYLGGSGDDFGRSVAVNVAGSAYVTGVAGPNFPTLFPLPTPLAGFGFVTKFTPSGTALVYSTILSGVTYGSFGIALDFAGNAFATGSTNGSIVTAFPFQATNGGGGTDGWVSVIADPTIIGRVVDENGSPLGGAIVNLTGVPSATTTTDENGYYTFALLNVGGSYTVSVFVSNFNFNSAAVNNLQKNVRVDFVPLVVNISGQVTLNTNGLSGVTITTSPWYHVTQTDALGNYSLGNLPAGRNYTVTPAENGFQFTPPSSTFNNISTNQTANFVATPLPPVITSPTSAAGTIGQQFVYQFETRFATSRAVTNLPPDLTFNAGLSAITGTPTAVGTFQVGLSASNTAGTTTATLTITVQPVPPSGPVIISSAAATGRTGQPFSFHVITTGGSPSARLSTSGLPPGLTYDPVSGLISGTPTLDGSFAVTLTVTDGNVTTTSILQLTFTSDPTVPVIISPDRAALTPGEFFSYTISAPSSADPSDPTIFTLIGTLPSGLGFDAATGTISGIYTGPLLASVNGGPHQPELAGGALLGSVQLFATNSHGTSTFQLLFLPAPSGAVNISTRLLIGTGENVLIGGFIIQGTAPKVVIIRALGPSTGIPGALQDPTLELHDSAGNVVSNDDWRTDPTQEQFIIGTTIPPADDRESAIVAGLDPGSYTAIVAGKKGATGIALVEVYDLGTGSIDISGNARLANISTRGFVDTGDNVMIGGFIIHAPATRVIVRAIGPELNGSVPGALQDTTLELHDGSGSLIASNDDWRSTQEQEIIDTTVPPTDDRESAIVATLDPGNYTAIVSGKDNTTGVALVEVYALQ
jgi:Carboxypeptidase regulatory-like domain/Beta-propeller repeat/Putative Ig domain